MINIVMDKKNIIIGLYFKCPVTQDKPENCQMCELRKLPFNEFYARLENMSEEEINKIISTHLLCPKNNLDFPNILL